MTTVIEYVSKILLNNIEIRSIRGDFDKTFVRGFLANYLTERNIRNTSQMYTNRNHHAIRTIPDILYNLGQKASLFDNNLMQKVIHAYNNKIHKVLFNRFMLNQGQHNSMIEHTYIIEKNLEFDKVNQTDGEVRVPAGGYFTVPHPYERNFANKKEKKLRHARILYKIHPHECAYSDLFFESTNICTYILHEVLRKEHRYARVACEANIF
jgi:hypothetical protein